MLTAAAGAHAQLTTPGAGKWYRSGDRRARQSVQLRVDAQALVEWLPQETIVFDGAEAELQTRVELAAGALFCGWDLLCLGRTASGERFAHGRLDLATRIEQARSMTLTWAANERAARQGGVRRTRFRSWPRSRSARRAIPCVPNSRGFPVLP